MSIAETPVEIIQLSDAVPESKVTHYVCCRVRDGEPAVTRAFCGETILWSGSEDVGLEVCKICEVLASVDGCPLGEWCEVVK